MSPSATTSGPHTRRQISMPTSETSVATRTTAPFSNAVFSDDVFGFAAVNALGMRFSKPGEDHRQQLRALRNEKKDHEHRGHDRDRHDPIAPAFAQETKHVVCCQREPDAPHLAPRPLRRGAEGESSWCLRPANSHRAADISDKPLAPSLPRERSERA